MKDTPPTPPPKPSIHLNIEDWMPCLADQGIPETDKIQLIETLWSIVLHFVDLGWDFESSENTSGQSLDLTAALQAAVLNSNDTEEAE